MSDSEKIIWIYLRSGDEYVRFGNFISSIEKGFQYFFCLPEDISKFRKAGKANLASTSEDFDPDFLVFNLADKKGSSFEKFENFGNASDSDNLKKAVIGLASNKSDIDFILSNSDFIDYAFIKSDDWKIIPLENLRAKTWDKKTKIIACSENAADAKIALEVLESGIDGVLIDFNTDYLIEIKEFIDSKNKKIEFAVGEIISVEILGSGDRVCVDTCHILKQNEGMLVGSASNGFFLVLSEASETIYSSARPFRVNAGAVHSYLISDEKTFYLSELKAGKMVSVVDTKGNIKSGIVGRSKIEKRPLILLKAKSKGKTISVILQNAETVKIASSDGKPISVTEIKPGDKVLTYIESDGARHFGNKIVESLIEK